MEKRIILAFILSFGVLYAFRALYAPPEPATQPSAPSATSTPAPAPQQSSTPVATPGTSRVAEPTGELRSEKSENLVVDTPLYTATVSNVGGGLTSYKLKAYSDAAGKSRSEERRVGKECRL